MTIFIHKHCLSNTTLLHVKYVLEFSFLSEFISQTINYESDAENRLDFFEGGMWGPGVRWLDVGLRWSHGSCDCEEAVHCVRHSAPQRKSLLILF